MLLTLPALASFSIIDEEIPLDSYPADWHRGTSMPLRRENAVHTGINHIIMVLSLPCGYSTE